MLKDVLARVFFNPWSVFIVLSALLLALESVKP
jgi:hypothetical protein